MKKVIIFLDIDGVFSTRKALEESWEDYTGCKTFDDSKKYMKKYKIPWPHLSMYDWPFDKECCSNFHLLQRKLYEMGIEPCVVISSSWRTAFNFKQKQGELGTIKEIFTLKGLQVANIIGRTPSCGDRGEEILKYLKKNKIKCPYVSIDDENKYDVEKHIGKEKCISPKFKTGFQKKYIKETIQKIKDQING